MHRLTESLRGPQRQFYVHGLKALKPNHPEVLALQDCGHLPREFGSRIWRSTYLLVDYLAHHLAEGIERAVELGCGWGLAGLYLQKFRGINVTATDIDHNVLAYQQLLCEHNDTAVESCQSSVRDLCRWNLQTTDLLIGADICYCDDIAAGISDLCGHLANQGGGQLILADSGRRPFQQLCTRLGRRYKTTVTQISLNLPTTVQGQILRVEIAG